MDGYRKGGESNVKNVDAKKKLFQRSDASQTLLNLNRKAYYLLSVISEGKSRNF